MTIKGSLTAAGRLQVTAANNHWHMFRWICFFMFIKRMFTQNMHAYSYFFLYQSGIGEKKRRRCRLEVIPRTEHKARKQGSIGREEIGNVKGYEEPGPGGTEVFNNPETTEEISPDALESVPGEPMVKRRRRNRKKKKKDNTERRKTKICIDENGVQHIIRRVRRDTLVGERVEMMVGPPVKP